MSPKTLDMIRKNMTRFIKLQEGQKQEGICQQNSMAQVHRLCMLRNATPYKMWKTHCMWWIHKRRMSTSPQPRQNSVLGDSQPWNARLYRSGIKNVHRYKLIFLQLDIKTGIIKLGIKTSQDLPMEISYLPLDLESYKLLIAQRLNSWSQEKYSKIIRVCRSDSRVYINMGNGMCSLSLDNIYYNVKWSYCNI